MSNYEKEQLYELRQYVQCRFDVELDGGHDDWCDHYEVMMQEIENKLDKILYEKENL